MTTQAQRNTSPRAATGQAYPFRDYYLSQYGGDVDRVLSHFLPQLAETAAALDILLDHAPVVDGEWIEAPRLSGRTEGDRFYIAALADARDGVRLPRITFNNFKDTPVTVRVRELLHEQWQAERAAGGEAPAADAGQHQAHAERLAQLAQQAKQQAAARESERTAGNVAAAFAARDAWAAALPAAGHSYLTRKHLPGDGLRVAPSTVRARLYCKKLRRWIDNAEVVRAGDLLIPMSNAAGDVVNLQRIDGEGTKQFILGGRKTATLYRIGGDGAPWLAEGYATAWAVHASTGQPVVVAWDAGNLSHVAALLGDVLGVAADNDNNQAGQRAADATGKPWAAPVRGGADFWDVWRDDGADAVCDALARLQVAGVANDNAPAVAAILATATASATAAEIGDDIHDLPEIGSAWPHLGMRGAPRNTLPNMRHLLKYYGITARYNAITKAMQVEIPGQPSSVDNGDNVALAKVSSLCELNGLSDTKVGPYLLTIADENTFNPVAEMIRSRPWDGRSRLTELAETLTLAPGYMPAMRDLLVRRWLISGAAAALGTEGVRRADNGALHGPYKGRGVITLQGPQSIGKTAWFAALMPAGLSDAFLDGHILDPGDKDSVMTAVSHWIVELGEVDATLKRGDVAALKAFLTKTHDILRRPYAKTDSTYPRRTAFCASVNPEQFLIDPTGNSRFWTIAVQSVNHEHGIDVQQVWAEVASLFLAGEPWWLNAEEEQALAGVNDRHNAPDAIRDLVREAYDPARAPRVGKLLSATAALREIFNDVRYKPQRPEILSAAATLKELFGPPIDSNGVTGWRLPLHHRETTFNNRPPVSDDFGGPF